MKIQLTSIQVDDQDRALRFYTEVLRFVKKQDFPVGEHKWLTVVSPEGPPDVELALEPNANPVGKAFQQGLYAQGIPATAFAVDDIRAEYQRLVERGVSFNSPPAKAGSVTMAVFDDTCGNYIGIYQV